jgi:hypothetical protein
VAYNAIMFVPNCTKFDQHFKRFDVGYMDTQDKIHTASDLITLPSSVKEK